MTETYINSLIAMTQAASFYRLVRPKVVQKNVIKIKGGRWVDSIPRSMDRFAY